MTDEAGYGGISGHTLHDGLGFLNSIRFCKIYMYLRELRIDNCGFGPFCRTGVQ